MSEVAGRMAVQAGATSLEKWRGGKGVLLGGVPGTRRGRVVILGGGVVGRNAAKIAIGMGAQVTVLDVHAKTMDYLEDIFGGSIETLYSNPANIEEAVMRADLVIGAVLVTGAKAPTLVDRALVGKMEKGSVIVDVAIDQGGCIETVRPTSHDHPTYEVDGVIHYCVPNMPGAVSHTSTFALTNTTMKYALAIADKGVAAAAKADPAPSRSASTCYDGGKRGRRRGGREKRLSVLLQICVAQLRCVFSQGRQPCFEAAPCCARSSPQNGGRSPFGAPACLSCRAAFVTAER